MTLDGVKVVVTGKIAGESRQTAEQKLREAGARVQAAVGKDTELLVTGASVGAKKLNAARDQGVRIVPWEEVWSPLQATGLGVQEAAAAQEHVEAVGEPRSVRQIGPMLCSAVSELPVGFGWLFEVKWDGYRCVATIEDGHVTMQSRTGKSDYAERFPQIAAALAGFPDCVLDGELVVLDEKGRSSFASLVGGGKGNGAARYVVFDLLEAYLEDMRGLSLEERQGTLVGLIAGRSPLITHSPTFEDGEALLKIVRRDGLEGIVAKRLGSRYQEGRRGPEWVKVKVRPEQEFVVVGWTPGEGALAGTIGALILAVHDAAGDLILAGKVGTGFDHFERRRLAAKLEPLALAGPSEVMLTAKQHKVSVRDKVTWVRPEVVVQVEFQRWTEDGVLWHPSYKGERTDKRTGEVVREATMGGGR